mmetsp:Transcript_26215/g.42173  ORF Transcript_26215/g.42173 Transcript_26215/m.42173 type:complete len:281 (+) Transcript_26215:250-1092(+)
MLTWGFEAEAIRMARSKYIKDKKKEKHFQLHNEEMPESDSSSTSSEGGGNSSDEEYFRQIAGIVVEQGDEEEEEKEIENEAKEIFNEIDSNHSDNVSFKEFLDFWKRHCAQGMLTSGSPRNDNISGPFPNALHMHNFPPPSPPPQPLDGDNSRKHHHHHHHHHHHRSNHHQHQQRHQGSSSPPYAHNHRKPDTVPRRNCRVARQARKSREGEKAPSLSPHSNSHIGDNDEEAMATRPDLSSRARQDILDLKRDVESVKSMLQNILSLMEEQKRTSSSLLR